MIDSTKLVEAQGDVAAGELWARHDRVARDLLVPHGGREIDRTDGFLLLFERASDAVAYALAYHLALVPLGLRARAGVHFGSVVLTANRLEDVALGAKPLEVDGMAKPIGARVMSVATGGQTLLTPDALEAWTRDGGPAAGQRVVSHGTWQMKGLSASSPG